MKKNNKVIFHNTQLLLEHYRDVVWSLEVSVFRRYKFSGRIWKYNRGVSGIIV